MADVDIDAQSEERTFGSTPSDGASNEASEVMENGELPAKRVKLEDASGCPFASARNGSGGAGLDRDERKRNIARLVTSAGIDVDEADESLDTSIDADYDDEIDDLLEESGDAINHDYITLTKTFLQRAPVDVFNVLPDNWIEITHKSGLIVYLHRPTRVCTFGRPYFIGEGSARFHNVPKSAIPCFYQRHLAEEESKRLSAEEEHINELAGATEDDPDLAIKSKLSVPLVKIQDSAAMQKSELTPEELHKYAAQAFAFKTVNFRRYSDWRGTREHYREIKRKNMAQAKLNRPMLPTDTQLITLPPINPNGREACLNPKGKSAVGVLYEYVQKGLKSVVLYDIYTTQDALKPYAAIAKIRQTQGASVFIAASTFRERLAVIAEQTKAKLTQEGRVDELSKMDDMIVVGRGSGSNKKSAKAGAAIAALSIFIPELKFNDTGCVVTDEMKDDNELAIFDLLDIEDTRITALSQKTGQRLPYVILQECLSKCQPFIDVKISLETKRISQTKSEATLRVGEKVVTVNGCSTNESKQLAAQKMLKVIYPQFEKYGSILRLYGFHVKQVQKELRVEQKDFQKQIGGIRCNKDGRRTPRNEVFLKTVANHMTQFSIQVREKCVAQVATAPFALPTWEPDVPHDAMTDAANEGVSQHGDPFSKELPKI